MPEALPQVDMPAQEEVRDLLALLTDPVRAPRYSPSRWDRIVRVARATETLGPLAYRLDAPVVVETLPEIVRRHLEGAKVVADHRKRLGLKLVKKLGPVLDRPGEGSLVLLKGLAYATQSLNISRGRVFDDVDILVPRRCLDEVEAILTGGGWITELPDPYDQRYYREWSHELPPMRHPHFAMQLDVHHTIVPVTSCATPDTRELFEHAVPSCLSPWKVLDPADQVLHAAAHLFLDSDCSGRLRELVDLDGLLREFGHSKIFWPKLVARAGIHGLGRYLWYAAVFCGSWLGSPIPPHAAEEIARFAPRRAAQSVTLAAMRRALPPADIDGRATRYRPLSHRLLVTRAALLRMPFPLLLYHATQKLLRSRMRQP